MFNQKIIKMKTVVFIMAATVLLLIGLGNHDNHCATVNSSNVSPVSRNPVETNTKISTADAGAPGDILNFSGKSMNFFLVTF